MKRDEYIPKGKWQFDAEVAAVFDDMISRSIPDYETMRDLTTRIGHEFIFPHLDVADLGCSTGLGIERLIGREQQRDNSETKFYLFDTSEPMLAICKEKFKDCPNVIVEECDITRGIEHSPVMPYGNYSLVLSILTLQFVPIEYRQSVVQDVYNSLCEGGAFLIVEKVLGYSCPIDEVLKKLYYDIKRDNSYTEDQIAEKRKSLEGTLVPITETANRQMLEAAGFRRIDTYWRYLNFVGLIAIK